MGRGIKLETELRIRIQLMRLEQDGVDCACCYVKHDNPKAWNPSFLPEVKPAPSTWVKLNQCPGLCSSDEALLLCQVTQNQWLVWVPDYGELILEREGFYLLGDVLE
jgi:hypothetical protein